MMRATALAKSITKTELIQRIAREVPYATRKLSRQIVNAFMERIIWALRRRGRLELRDFGVFSVVETEPRVGRNPATGDPVDIPAQKHVRFKMSKHMREVLNK